jgi:hypothetical protein
MAVKAERSVEPPAAGPMRRARNGSHESVGFRMPWRFIQRISWHGANWQRCWRNWSNRKRPCVIGTRSWPAIPTV